MSGVIEIYPFSTSTFENAEREPIVEAGERRGLFIDVETCGKEPLTDPLIQFAAVPFAFTPEGKVTHVARAFVALEDPGRAIPQEITELTGITNEMVKGKRLPEGQIADLVGVSDIVIAHNADFDRKVVEQRGLTAFENARFGCSYVDVPWKDEYDCAKLSCLMYRHARMYYQAHRADIDCYAGVTLLATVFPREAGKNALSYVLDNMKVSHAQIVVKPPISDLVKATLEGEGYKWRKENGKWLGMVRELKVGDEAQKALAFLDDLGVSSVETASFDSRRRFSKRIKTTPRQKYSMAS